MFAAVLSLDFRLTAVGAQHRTCIPCIAYENRQTTARKSRPKNRPEKSSLPFVSGSRFKSDLRNACLFQSLPIPSRCTGASINYSHLRRPTNHITNLLGPIELEAGHSIRLI